MNIKVFYDSIGGSYEDAIQRLMNDTLIEKFLKKFKDYDFSKLTSAVNDKDYYQIFVEAHTLKGVALNLSLMKLGESASKLTELLRGEERNSVPYEQIYNLYQLIERNYNLVIENLD